LGNRSSLLEKKSMSGVRVLAGTRKGAFILTSDEKREKWDVSGPHFAGWEIYHLKVHGFRRSLTWDANIQERLRM